MKSNLNITPGQAGDGIEEKNLLLTSRNMDLADLIYKEADAKRDYAIALAQEITKMKIEGQSVTLIKELAKGNEKVADLRYRRDIASGEVNVCRESIRDIRAALDSYRSILTWLREEMGRS